MALLSPSERTSFSDPTLSSALARLPPPSRRSPQPKAQGKMGFLFQREATGAESLKPLQPLG